MEELKITIVGRRKIMKYAEGADPSKDEPYEVVEKEFTLKGIEALDYLEQLQNGGEK